MDLSSVDLVTLQGWYKKALDSYAASQNGARLISVSYTQGSGSRTVTYAPTSIADLQAWITRLGAELACRGALVVKQRRRAIGVRF